MQVGTELKTLKITSSYEQRTFEWKGPVSFPQREGPWQFSGISQAFLSKISGKETHSLCAIYWGQKVKGQNPALYQ